MRVGITSAIKYHRQSVASLDEKIKKLCDDIQNCPYHVFGEHQKCSNYFCGGPKQNEKIYISAMLECGLLDDILVCGNRLKHHASSLLLNMTNNAAECYNSIVCKFTGGKRINFAIKDSYELRCRAAAIKFNKKSDYISTIYKKKCNKEPGKYTKQYLEHIKKNTKKRIQRKKMLKATKKNKKSQPADKDYGLVEDETSEKEFEKKKSDYLKNIQKSKQEIDNIELTTRGQASNFTWLSIRTKTLSSSNFGLVCKRRDSTNPTKLVQRLVSIQNIWSSAIQWGRDHEELAKRDFEIKYKKK